MTNSAALDYLSIHSARVSVMLANIILLTSKFRLVTKQILLPSCLEWYELPCASSALIYDIGHTPVGQKRKWTVMLTVGQLF
jgi:hypothetical protein